MYEIRHIKIWPFARYMAMLAGAGALAFCIFAPTAIMLNGIFAYGYNDLEKRLHSLTVIYLSERTIITILISIIFSKIIAFCGGAMAAWCYNWFAPRHGGLKIEMKQVTDDPHSFK